MKRSRGRNRRSGGNNQNNFNNPNRHFESVGPDVKIRGSAQQVLEKYLQYARDAQTSGDRILSEAYYQFAEHYQRIVAKQQEVRDRQQQQRGNRDERDQGRRDDRDSGRSEDDDDTAASSDEAAETSDVRVESRKPSEDRDEGGDDAMRVIDADEPAAEVSDDGDKDEPRRKGGRRRPYNRRDKEEAAEATDASDPADGVMKTLSRGRRKSSEEGAETSAEATE
ncbi:MAG: DUF4167 domain-containing protein [Hyphomonas sp.]|nr:DUF4167 domain-containing protein [Hyphomonas sp.]MCB9972247.1 DUF4167 domain-containing protein [Hyphomonas sp.]